MNKTDDKNRIVTYWHIDEIYLTSIWERIDSYNKGLEKATNLTILNKLAYYRSCWTLLKNVYYDYSPYFKKFKNHFDKLKDLKPMIFSNPPSDVKNYKKWERELEETIDLLDERKREVVLAMANRNSLLSHKTELSTKNKIKKVMAD